MRICLFTDSFLPYCSGVTYSVLNQIEEMHRRGHRVMVVRASPGRSQTDKGIDLPAEVVDLPLSIKVPRVPDLYLAIPQGASLKPVGQFAPDVIHTATEWGCGWEGWGVARWLKVPLVGTFHTFFAEPGYLRSLGLPDWRLWREVMWRYEIAFFSRCDVVTSPSAAVRDALVQHGIEPSPVVVPNGIRLPNPKRCSDQAELRSRWGVTTTGPVYLYVGRISQEKSLDVVMRAFRKVVDAEPTAQFVLIGDGPSRPELESLIQKLNLTPRVKSFGLIPNRQLLDESLPLLGDAFVTASTTENQPMSILEAMAFGLPVIGANAKGIPELVEHGKTGLLFEPDNVCELATSMLQIARDELRRARFADQSRARAQSFTAAGAVRQLEDIYQLAITRRQEKQSRGSSNPAAHAARPRVPTARWYGSTPDPLVDASTGTARKAS